MMFFLVLKIDYILDKTGITKTDVKNNIINCVYKNSTLKSFYYNIFTDNKKY